MATVDPAAEPGPCIHRPPSPGQSLCSCGHQQIELQYAERIAAHGATLPTADERAALIDRAVDLASSGLAAENAQNRDGAVGVGLGIAAAFAVLEAHQRGLTP